MFADNRKAWYAFAGGEITEELFGRVDLQELNIALATCDNFQVLPHGPVISRAGSQFIISTKSNGIARLIPFVRGNGDALVLEFGDTYIRFHRDDGTVEDPMSPGNPYEVTTPYQDTEVFDLKFEQSVDTITIVHPSYRHRELIRTADDDWDLDEIVHESPIDPPASAPTVVALGATGNALTYRYVVTAVDARNEESIASDIGGVINDLQVTGQLNTITWAVVSGAVYYNVYKEWAESGRFYFIASTVDNATGVVDDNIIPDFTKAPPEATDPFGTDGGTTTPSAVSYFEQRRVFAATTGDPQRFWLTKSGSFYNMNVSIVPQDGDPFNYNLSSMKAHTIQHIISTETLLMLTGSALWRIYPDSGGFLSPLNAVSKANVQIGSTSARPALYREYLMYANAKGQHLISVKFSTEAGGYQPEDLSLVAPHLIQGLSWVQMDFQESPHPTWWGVRSDGVLIGMTYAPDQNVIAWHQHHLGGEFSTGHAVVESIAVVPSNSGTEDVVYLIVKRTINGGTKRFVEFITTRQFVDLDHSFCVDAGLLYDATPITTVTGLSHLIGQSVTGLADGVVFTKTVNGSGEITLDAAASTIVVGLGYNCDIVTPPLSYQASAQGMEQQEIISGVRLRVKDTAGLSAGKDFSTLTAFQDDPWESPGLKSKVIDVEGDFEWNEDNKVYIRQQYPLPALITGLMVNFAPGN